MEQNYSLMAILRDDPDFAGALQAKKEAVKKDKQNLLSIAESYAEKYHDEIVEGTKKRQKLLTEGQSQGLTEEEIFKGNKQFMPTVYTPILNFLYFMFREEAKDERKKIQTLTEEYIKEFGYQNLIDAMQEDSDPEKEENTTLEDILSADTHAPEESDHFIYGNMDHDTFKKIKKLKALSKSPNEKEAFLAYRKCLELCERYGLEFDKIPCRVKTPIKEESTDS